MKVAVIILNYNSSDDCRKCVSYLKRQEGVELELILVDNCSPDGDKIETLCREQGCTFIASPENRGYNAGNNIGLRYAAEKGYKYALIANPDMEFPQSDYVKQLVKVLEHNNEIVIVGSDILGANNIHQNPANESDRWTASFKLFIHLFLRKKEKKQNNTHSGYCSKVCGCCLMIRMDFVQEICFFDEYPFLYCEESILSRQVEIAGKRIYYISEAQAIHRHIASTKGDPVQRFLQWKRSRLYYINHYSGDCWIGKKLASLSITLYVELFSLLKKK